MAINGHLFHNTLLEELGVIHVKSSSLFWKQLKYSWEKLKINKQTYEDLYISYLNSVHSNINANFELSTEFLENHRFGHETLTLKLNVFEHLKIFENPHLIKKLKGNPQDNLGAMAKYIWTILKYLILQNRCLLRGGKQLQLF